MSDHGSHTLPTDCSRFEDWLAEGGDADGLDRWTSHLESCAGCREQWASHRLLVAAFAGEAVPELSPAFQAGLDRKLESANVRVAPLTGWRRAALVAYAALAVALMAKVFDRFPLPEWALDPSSPRTAVLAMLVVPLSLWLTMLATRFLPRQRPRGVRLLTL